MVKIYTPEANCPRCEMTAKWLERKGVSFEKVASTDEDIKEFKENGYASFPVVKVDSKVVSVGFNPAALKTAFG